MTSQEVLSWCNLNQGNAKKLDILTVWRKFPGHADQVFISGPEHPLSSLLDVGKTYTLYNALLAVGCKED